MIHAYRCSETGHPPLNQVSVVNLIDTHIRAFSDAKDRNRPYRTFKPSWLQMSREDARVLRAALSRALR